MTYNFPKAAFIILLLLFSQLLQSRAEYNISRFDYSWVTASYPTSYVSGSWSIRASAGGTFEKNKTGVTMIIDLPTGFEFKTSGSSASVSAKVSSPVIYNISFQFTSSTRITVTYSTYNDNTTIDTLYFRNFEIRATASGSTGSILRNGGTAKLSQTGGPSTANPSASETMGNLSAQTPMTYSSSTVTQNTTSNVNQYSINNEIIGIQIVVSGTGNPLSVTQFDLHTNGNNSTGTDDPANNITKASIFYSGTTNAFSTSNLYGYLNSVNGAFTITGSQTLSEGTNYFWLAYDIYGGANTTHKVDARLVSFILSGSTKTDMTASAPTGSRNIVPASYYYAIANGNINSLTVWSNTDNGATCNCAPNGSGVVVIDTNRTITVNADRTVDVIDIKQGGILNGSSIITINSTLTTSSTGKFQMTKEMIIPGNVTLAGSGASSNSKYIDIGGTLTIGSGTSLTMSGGGTEHLYIGGTFILNGTLFQTGGADIILDGGSNNIEGSGTIDVSNTTSDLIVNAGNKTIVSAANLTIEPDFSIEGAYTITNNGIASIQGDLLGNNANSTWLNAANSTLNIGGAVLATGILTASANNNLVNYNGSANQTVKVPSTSYHDFNCTTGGTKTLAGAIDIDGVLTIGSGATLDASTSNYTISLGENFSNSGNFTARNGTLTFDGNTTISGSATTSLYHTTITGTLVGISSGNFNVAGTWTNNGTFTHNNGTATFNGSANQSLAGSNSTTFYNLTTNNSSTGITLNKNTTVLNNLTFSDGDINLNGFNIDLSTVGSLVSETNDKRIYGTTGVVTTTRDVNAPSALNIAGMGVILTSSANFGSTTIQRGHAAQTSGGNSSLKRYFDITPTNNSNLNATLRMYYFENELNGQMENEIKYYRSTNGGSTWTERIGSHNSTDNYCELTAVDQFSRWTISSSSSPLPISLLAFEAEVKDEMVYLSWSTAMEVNNDYFTIERSVNGIDYEIIEQIEGAGNSNSVLSYLFMDKSPEKGISYYRLKQNDYNGEYSYYDPVAVNLSVAGFNIYPNPSIGGTFTIELPEGSNEAIVEFYDYMGKLESKNFYTCSNAVLQIRLDESKWHKQYLLKVISNNTPFYSKLIME